MFYKTKIKDHIRVPPDMFELSTRQAVIKMIKKKYEGFISKKIGVVIDVSDVDEINEGLIMPGDGAPYFESSFELLVFRPELQEVVYGTIRDIADFGAFINMGPIEGMVHISQTMDDFVSFSKDKVLAGKETKRTLKSGDKCKARLIAISYKDISNPKFGLSMRQPYLGKLEWVAEDTQKTSSSKETAQKGKKESKEKK